MFEPGILVQSGSVRISAVGREAADVVVWRLGRTCVPVCLALSAVLYSAWLLQFPLHLGIDPVHAYASELAAVTRPDHRLFMSTDLAAGVLAVAAAAIMLPISRPRSLRIAWLGLVVFGAATAVDSLLPLPCAPHTDPGCAAREATHQLPITDSLHLVSSAAAVAGLLAAIVCFTIGTRLGTLAHRTGVLISAVSVTTTVWTIAEVVVDDTSRTHEQVGLAQRLQLVSLAFGVAYIAWLSWTDRRDRDRTNGTGPGYPSRVPSEVHPDRQSGSRLALRQYSYGRQRTDSVPTFAELKICNDLT